MKTNLALLNKTILIVSANAAEDLSDTFNGFGCKSVFVGKPANVIDSIKENIAIDMVVLDVTLPIINGLQLVRQIRALKEDVPAIFVICDGVDSTLDEAFFEGVDAIFVRPLDLDELEKGVAFSYSEALENSSRRHVRKRVYRARVSYEFDWQKGKGYATNFSMGGMFVGSMDELPNRFQKIKFTVTFENEGQELISAGVVKWCRSRLTFGRPRGFGVEFNELDQATLKKFKQISNFSFDLLAQSDVGEKKSEP